MFCMLLVIYIFFLLVTHMSSMFVVSYFIIIPVVWYCLRTTLTFSWCWATVWMCTGTYDLACDILSKRVLFDDFAKQTTYRCWNWQLNSVAVPGHHLKCEVFIINGDNQAVLIPAVATTDKNTTIAGCGWLPVTKSDNVRMGGVDVADGDVGKEHAVVVKGGNAVGNSDVTVWQIRCTGKIQSSLIIESQLILRSTAWNRRCLV